MEIDRVYELYEKIYSILPKLYTFNYWKGNVTFEAGIDVVVNLRFDYEIWYEEEERNGKTYRYLNAYFVPTIAKELTFFDFLSLFSTFSKEKSRSKETEEIPLEEEEEEARKRCKKDRIYISIPDLYLNQLMREKGNFLIVEGREVLAFNFMRALREIRVYNRAKGTLQAPSIPFYSFSKSVKPIRLLYIISALHYYNAILNNEKNEKIKLLYPLVYWRFYEMNKNTLVSSTTVGRIATIIAKEKPEGYEELIKILDKPDNPFITEILQHAHNSETTHEIEKLQEILRIKRG